MTDQLIFPVLWSTQYNPKSVILFNIEMYNFHFSGLVIQLTYLKNNSIILKLQLVKIFRPLPQLCSSTEQFTRW